MEIHPAPLKRGDTLEKMDGCVIGAIGAFSRVCIAGEVLHQPLEVVLVEGSREKGFKARLGDSHHRLYEGPLTEAKVSFALESFKTDAAEDILNRVKKDSRTFSFQAQKNLRDFILESATKNKIDGALLYIKGVARDLHIYGHIDIHKLNDKTKTFDHAEGSVPIEGWGNLSFIDGRIPFVHMHGVYEKEKRRKGGHFIMDDKTVLMLDRGELLIHPVGLLIRKMEKEDFPTWQV